jgi:hypothetical protein
MLTLMLGWSERTFCASSLTPRFRGWLGGASRVRSEELDTARVPCQDVPHVSLADEETRCGARPAPQRDWHRSAWETTTRAQETRCQLG